MSVSVCNLRRTRLWCFAVTSLVALAGCKPNATSPQQPASTKSESAENDPLAKTNAAASDSSSATSFESAQPLDIGALIEVGKLDQAEVELKLRLVKKPNDSESLFWMARLKASQGRFEEAVQLLEAIPTSDPASVAAAGQSAQWLESLERWDEAAQRYKSIQEQVPDAAMVLRPLARILNRQGRRIEAGPLVAELCRQGDIEEEELRSLLTWTNAFASEDTQNAFAAIGSLGQARLRYSRAEYQRVIDSLEPLAFDSDAAVYSLYGRSIAMMQHWDRWSQWQDNPVRGCEDHADYWYARGLYALLGGDSGSGVLYFSEAIMRDSTDHTAYVRYSEALARVGLIKASSLANQRAELLRKTNEIDVDLARGQRDAERFANLADLLDSLQRPYEAIAWRAVALGYVRSSLRPELVSQLDNDLRLQRQKLEQTKQRPSEQDLLCGLTRDELKERFPTSSSTPAVPFRPTPFDSKQEFAPLAVYNVASDVNLLHTYDNTNLSSPNKHGILQEMGSGVVVTDYDLDGRPDIYLPQASATPMQQDGNKPNLLYRSLGNRFESVTVQASADDRSFSQGATAGDVNQDGFPDLCIANVGHNHLLINNGDGTYTATMLAPDSSPEWTSSLAIGDVTGDHLPDIVEINYIDDPTAFERHESPTKFQHAVDQVHFSDGRGRFITTKLGEQRSSGLGVVMTDLDGDGRNEVFVANDGRPDRLWVRSNQRNGEANDDCLNIPKYSTSDGGSHFLCNHALARGCSTGFQGLAGASMGIAVDDFNLDGRPDLFVTQFYQEPDVFYCQTEHGTFVDRSVQLGTYEPSLKVLGFGTQSIDLDNDSFVEIAVLNGHTARSSNPNIPYEMLPQVYRRDLSGKYVVTEISDASDYWKTRVLGRGLSKLDWNRDGRVDLVAVHLDHPTALLENRTSSDLSWLELRLVGTASERDAIGASVTVTTRDFKRFMTITSGDGYCGKNESVLHVGLANAVDAEVYIQWPSGKSSQIRIAEVNQRWLIVEGDDTAHSDQVARISATTRN